MATPSPSGTVSTQQASATGPIVPLDLDSSSEQEDIPASLGTKRKLRSNVWADFDQVEVDGGYSRLNANIVRRIFLASQRMVHHICAHI
jgi:hypothetical protein